MATLRETCSCGASFHYEGVAPHAAVVAFRSAHAACRALAQQPRVKFGSATAKGPV